MTSVLTICNLYTAQDLFMSVPRLLSADQKQQWLDVCFDFRPHAANDQSFLSNVVMGDETLVYAYTTETKWQSSQWKVCSYLNWTVQDKSRTTSSSMFIWFFFFFLIMREFFTGNLFLLVKESVLLSTLRSWTVCEWMWEKCGLTNGGTRHGFSTTTILQPMLPSRHNSFWPVNIWPWCPILCIH